MDHAQYAPVSRDGCPSQLGLPPIVEAAIFTLLIMPPPFIVPIYLPRTRHVEATYATNVLSLYTVVSVVAFIAWVTITA